MEAGVWHRRTVYLLIGSLNEVHDGIAFLRNIQLYFPDPVTCDLLTGTQNIIDVLTD